MHFSNNITLILFFVFIAGGKKSKEDGLEVDSDTKGKIY